MRKLYALFLMLAISTASFAASPSGYSHDPGAARKNLSNVDPATARTTLGLAGIESIPANASFTLSLLSEKSYWSLTNRPAFGSIASESAGNYFRLDGSYGITGENILLMSSNGRTNISIASTSGVLCLMGADSPGNGAYIWATGNGHSNKGILALNSGTDSASTVSISAGGHTRAQFPHEGSIKFSGQLVEADSGLNVTGNTETDTLTVNGKEIIGAMNEADTTYCSLTANTNYSISALTGRKRIMVQNLSTSENVWIAPGSTVATVSQSLCIVPLGTYAEDYDDTVPIAIIASTAQPIAFVQEAN